MFNKTLSLYRERAGIRKADLARKIHVSLTYIANLESGRQKPPTKETCERLAQALCLTEQESKELLELAVLERLTAADFNTIKNRLNTEKSSAPPTAIEKPNKAPLLSWEHANKLVIDDEIPIGLETVFTQTPLTDHAFALRIQDAAMAPEFHPEDIVIINTCPAPKDGDFVVVADHQGREPLLRQYKDYGKARVLHPLGPQLKDIILGEDRRYAIVGKVVERISPTKKY